MNNSRPDKLTRILIEKVMNERMPRAGSYAWDVAMGAQRLSGSDLRGKASRYGAQYARTRSKVLRILKDAGLAREAKGPHGLRYLEYDQ